MTGVIREGRGRGLFVPQCRFNQEARGPNVEIPASHILHTR